MNNIALSNSFQNNIRNCVKYFLTCVKQELRKNKYYDESNIKILAKKLEKNDFIQSVSFEMWDTEYHEEHTVTPFSISVVFNVLSDGYEVTVDVDLSIYGVLGNIITDGIEDSYVNIEAKYKI